MMKMIVITCLLLSTVGFAASPEEKAQAKKNYETAMKEAPEQVKDNPEFEGIQQEFITSRKLLITKAREMLPSVDIEKIGDIWPREGKLRKHPAYPEFSAARDRYMTAIERRNSFFYLHSMPFKKAMDDYRVVWGEDPFEVAEDMRWED